MDDAGGAGGAPTPVEANVREDPDRFPEEVRAAVGSGTSWAGLCLFAELIGAEGETRGLVGPRELPKLWSRHIVNSLAINGFVPEGVRVADVGSGAGFPGVVLAITRPDLSITLIETMERRCDWLVDVRDRLGLQNVRVVNARAESLHGRETFPVVTARAVAAMDKLVRWTLPLVEEHGALLALKGVRASDEVVQAAAVLRSLRAEAQIHRVVSPLDGDITRVVEIRRVGFSQVARHL